MPVEYICFGMSSVRAYIGLVDLSLKLHKRAEPLLRIIPLLHFSANRDGNEYQIKES